MSHPSIPRNLLIAEPLFLARYIEKVETGTLDMFALSHETGLPVPEFRPEPGLFVQTLRRPEVTGGVTPEVTPEVTGEVTGEVRRLILSLDHAMARADIQTALGLRGQGNFRTLYLVPALNAGLI